MILFYPKTPTSRWGRELIQVHAITVYVKTALFTLYRPRSTVPTNNYKKLSIVERPVYNLV